MLHIQGRLNRINVNIDEAERKRTNFIFLLANAIESLKDADYIANFNHDNSRGTVSNSQLDKSSFEHNHTSCLDMTIMSQSSEPRVAQLIDFEMIQQTVDEDSSYVRLEKVVQHSVLKNYEIAYSTNQQICTRLLEILN